MPKWKIMAGRNRWELSGDKEVASSFWFRLRTDLFQIVINDLPLQTMSYWSDFQVKSEGDAGMKGSQKIAREELRRLGSENKLQRDRAGLHTLGLTGICCNLRAWELKRKEEQKGLHVFRRLETSVRHCYDAVRKKAHAVLWYRRWSVCSGDGKCWRCRTSPRTEVARPTQRSVPQRLGVFHFVSSFSD